MEGVNSWWSGQDFSTETKAQTDWRYIVYNVNWGWLTSFHLWALVEPKSYMIHKVSFLSFHKKFNLLNRQNEDNTGLWKKAEQSQVSSTQERREKVGVPFLYAVIPNVYLNLCYFYTCIWVGRREARTGIWWNVKVPFVNKFTLIVQVVLLQWRLFFQNKNIFTF